MQLTLFGDADVRQALRRRIFKAHAHEPDTVVLDELGVCRGQARVDVAVVNGLLHGYEIKSDRDSLRRLPVQVDYYSRVLDRATLVVGERHVDDAQQLVPAWWGVITYTRTRGRPGFRTVREGTLNPVQDVRALAELLWLDHAIALLERHGLARGVRGKPRQVVWDRVCTSLDAPAVAAEVRAHLKETAAQRGTPRSG